MLLGILVGKLVGLVEGLMEGVMLGCVEGKKLGVIVGFTDVGVNVGVVLYAQQTVLVGAGQEFVCHGIEDIDTAQAVVQKPVMTAGVTKFPQLRNVGCTDGFEVG
jgi:hypothetical protein